MKSEVKWLRKANVAARYGVDQSTITRWSKSNPNFPKPVQISDGVTAWNLDELDAHDRARMKASHG